MGNMTADRFWELLSKKISSEATDGELHELETILLGHPDLRHIADTLSILENQVTHFENNSEAQDAFQKHVEKILKTDAEFEKHYAGHNRVVALDDKLRSRRKKWALALLAVVAASFGFYLLTISMGPGRISKQAIQSQVTTKPGSKTQIQLPDGSSVWLNASSKLTYGENFGKKLREVNLTGEAFFDVVKDPSHPFIIHTTVVDVKVLGTAFNVRSYPNDANTETSVLRGQVEVTVKNRENTRYYLKPNEKVIVANGLVRTSNPNTKKQEYIRPIVSIQPLTYYYVDSSIVETSWVENKLVFQENETFSEVALKMERWYGVHISFEDPRVAEYRMYGSFTSETIRQALDALKIGFNFNYKMNKDEIIITK